MTNEGAPSPAEATASIRSKLGPQLSIVWTRHARERLVERGLVASDLLHLMRFGFVVSSPQPAKQPGRHVFLLEGTTPNSAGRILAAAVIVGEGSSVKVVTFMWKDEAQAYTGRRG